MNFVSALFAVVAFVAELFSIYNFIESRTGTKTRTYSILGMVGAGILLGTLLLGNLPATLGAYGSRITTPPTSDTQPQGTGLTPTPTPTPSPTPTPAPKPGDVLYQANSAWSGWNGTKDWKVNGGLLLNDGTYADYNAAPTIVAPYQSGSIADYAVEIQVQVVSAFTTGTIYPCFYIAIRGKALSNGWQGYFADVCANLGHGPAVQIVAVDSSNNIFDVLSTTPFDPQNAWHSYRVEAKGTAIKFFVTTHGGLRK